MNLRLRLHRAGLRATEGRVAVLRAIAAARTAVTVPHIAERVDDHERAIRRNLALAAEGGIVERVERPPSPFVWWRLRT